MTHPSRLNRRGFLKQLALVIASIPMLFVAGSGLSRAAEKAAAPKKDDKKGDPLPDGQKEVPATDAVAQAIGYKANVADIDYKRYPQRKDAKNKNQFCENCALYTGVNKSWGKCSMLTSGLVAAKGWCGSYSKKA